MIAAGVKRNCSLHAKLRALKIGRLRYLRGARVWRCDHNVFPATHGAINDLASSEIQRSVVMGEKRVRPHFGSFIQWL